MLRKEVIYLKKKKESNRKKKKRKDNLSQVAEAIKSGKVKNFSIRTRKTIDGLDNYSQQKD